MNRLPAADQLVQGLQLLLGQEACGRDAAGEVFREPLPSSRQVFRFTFPGQDSGAVVGKFFSAYPPETPGDRGLVLEYGNYLKAQSLGLTNGSPSIPRLWGRLPELCLGLLLEAIPGPDLDRLLLGAAIEAKPDPLYRGLESLAQLLAFFHTRPVPETPVSSGPALAYLDKVVGQLLGLGVLTPADAAALTRERGAWAARFEDFADRQVLVHGDATPTNFLFPEGRAVALDLERLGVGDRLWDLSWIAGELKHAFGWRTGNPEAAEPFIGHFFRAYLATLPPDAALAHRIYFLNPFYMALAEMRIARNAYLSLDYRRELAAEARRCLAFKYRF